MGKHKKHVCAAKDCPKQVPRPLQDQPQAKVLGRRVYFCSRECYWSDREDRRRRTCAYVDCGREIFIAQRHYVGTAYCGTDCQQLAMFYDAVQPGRTKKVYRPAQCVSCLRTELIPAWFPREARFCERPRCQDRLKVWYSHSNRARAAGVPFEMTEAELCIAARRRKCQACGSRFKRTGTQTLSARELHHIVPLSMGGAHAAFNVVALCKKCHVEADHAVRSGTFDNWPRSVLRGVKNPNDGNSPELASIQGERQ